MKDTKKKSSTRLRLIRLDKDGRGVSKSAKDMQPGFKRFFRTYFDSFGKIVSTNIIMVLGNFPLFFLIMNLSGYFKTELTLPMSDLFQNLGGHYLGGNVTPYHMTLFALEGMQSHVLYDTTVNYVFYAISALALFTFGIVNVGCAYILRNIASGEPVFVWHDFKYAVKRNYKQALPFGIIDAIICIVLGFNIFSLLTSTDKFFLSVMFWSNVVIAIVYFFMRYYVYVQMVTFKLTIFKIIKNSLLFSLIGLKRNFMALIGIILGVILELMFLFVTGGVLIPFAIAAPLAVLFSTFAYMKVYASYFKIKEVMIDPYYAEHPTETANDEPIMRDDVTEKARLEEIKAKNNIK